MRAAHSGFGEPFVVDREGLIAAGGFSFPKEFSGCATPPSVRYRTPLEKSLMKLPG
jgi:hypothetical protein